MSKSTNQTNDYTNVYESLETLYDISDEIKELKFKKKLFGGVDLLDVWRKLSQIDKKYQDAIRVQKEFYEERLAQAEKSICELELRDTNTEGV